ncbi:MAG: Omp28-related outer membrane protein [Muribaculaceae bacterium]|nr:Omp28-related outer membrane protein [Muribaculaceae bacterium]
MRHFVSACFLTCAAAMTTLGMVAAEKPVIRPFQVPGKSFMTGMSYNGKWATFTPEAGESIDKTYVVDLESARVVELPVTHIVEEDGYERKYDGFESVVANCVSEDGNIIAGSYGGEPGYYDKRDSKWHLLEYPNEGRRDKYVDFQAEVRKVRGNGKYMIGFGFNQAFDIVPLLWIDGKLTDLEGLPERDWKNHEIGIGAGTGKEGNIQFIDISDDGKTLLGGLSLNHPGWGSCYFVYDMETQEFEIMALNELNDLIASGVYLDDASELVGDTHPTFSPDFKKIVGEALLVRDNGSEFPDELYVPFVYDIASGKTEFLNDTDADNGVVGAYITNSGDIVGFSPYGSPARRVVFRSNGTWVDLESILDQTYDVNFVQATGFDSLSGVPFGLSEDGKTLLAMFPGTRNDAYVVHLDDMTFFDAASSINLMKRWQCEPAYGSSIARLDRVHVRFERACTPVENFDITISDKSGKSVKATAVNKYNSTGLIWTVEFPSTALADNEDYTVHIPAGTFEMDNSDQANVDINIIYVGREEKPMEMVRVLPAAGSGLLEIGANSMVGFNFSEIPYVVERATGYLYEEGKEQPVSNLLLSTSGNTLYAYTPSTRKLIRDVNYEIVIPAGSVVDLTGYCPNEEIRVNFTGLFFKEGTKGNVIFEENFDEFSEVYGHMMLFDGDTRIPVSSMEEFGFDQYNHPWNFTIRDSYEVEDYSAASTSMYTDGGQADDWMVTQQLELTGEELRVAFQTQGYLPTKQDRLKVIVWPCDDVIASLDKASVERMRTEGTVIYDEVVSPGESSQTLAGEWTDVVLPLDEFEGKKVYIAFVNNNTNESMVFLDNIKVTRRADLMMGVDMEETVVDATSVAVKAFVDVPAEDTNTYSSITATLTKGNFTSTYKDDGVSLKGGDRYYFSFPEELPLEKGKINEFTIEATLGDKIGTLSDKVANLVFAPNRRVVLEEATGTWCGNCPRAMVAIENLENTFPENFIPVAIHGDSSQDPWAMDNYVRVFLGMEAFPGGRVNRKDAILDGMEIIEGAYSFVSPTGDKTFMDAVAKELEELTVVEINIDSAEYFDNEIKVKANVEFALDLDRADYNIFTVLLEDKLVGVQSNYYQGNADPIFGDWAVAGAHVRHEFMDVPRGIAGMSFSGESGYLPRTVTAGEKYEAEITMDIPNVKDINNCKVVTMLVNTENGFIVNAARKALTKGDDSGVESIEGLAPVIFTVSGGTIFANGSDDVEVYDLTGSRLGNSGLSKGIYVVRAMGKVAKVMVK